MGEVSIRNQILISFMCIIDRVWARLDAAVTSGESGVSITDVNQTNVAEGGAKIIDWPDSLWIDCGTPDALLEAAKYAESGRLSPLPCNLRKGDYLPES